MPGKRSLPSHTAPDTVLGGSGRDAQSASGTDRTTTNLYIAVASTNTCYHCHQYDDYNNSYLNIINDINNNFDVHVKYANTNGGTFNNNFHYDYHHNVYHNDIYNYYDNYYHH